MNRSEYRASLRQIAIPVALQALLSSSFSIVDQIMIGQMGSASIAGVSIGGRFASIFWFAAGAITAAAGIMIAQYIGAKNDEGLRKSFWLNLLICILLALVFMGITLLFPNTITSLYTTDREVISIASSYLLIFCFSFIPQSISNLLSTILRCINKAIWPTIISFFGVGLNTLLNWIFIFGHFGVPAMGAVGAAWASLISIGVMTIAGMIIFYIIARKEHISLAFSLHYSREELRSYVKMLTPMLITELFWVIGENVYSALYGHIGTLALASMSIAITIISLTMGALSGLAQAAGIMVGRCLGEERYEEAYTMGWQLVKTSFRWALAVAAATAVIAPFYVQLYSVEESVRQMAMVLLWVFAFYIPIKTENMVLGSGVLRSGGKTSYIMWLNIFGTWCIGIPLGCLCTFVFHLPIAWVYAILSIEEAVRLALCYIVYRRKIWISTI